MHFPVGPRGPRSHRGVSISLALSKEWGETGYNCPTVCSSMQNNCFFDSSFWALGFRTLFKMLWGPTQDFAKVDAGTTIGFYALMPY